MAHGQMPERELEQIMSDFYHRKFNILVCTTIIETGIDIPTANTIIMDRADKLGLAQLHQLRGRVGRSHHQAYAYLLVPNKKGLTGDAEKRLEAIAKADELGAGFALASQAGVPLVQALTVVAQTVDNAFIGSRIEQMRDGIERGESISRCAAAVRRSTSCSRTARSAGSARRRRRPRGSGSSATRRGSRAPAARG